MMAEEEQPSAKRTKIDDGASEMHIGEDLSSPNTKLSASINRKLYLDEKNADIHFLCETNGISERIPAHKLILSTGSKVFETMFYGSIPEGDIVKISDGNPSAFKEFLGFFYLDEVKLTVANIADVMNLVRQYGIDRCMVQCIDFLKDAMTNDDVCSAYQLAVLFELDDLQHFCRRKISANAEEVLKTSDFLNCKPSLLLLIVSMDSLMCEEMHVFDSCLVWAKKSCEMNEIDPSDRKNLRTQLGDSVLHSIHFNRMKLEHFASRNANYEGLFTSVELAEILQLLVYKEFKPNFFTASPISYEIFNWDEQRIFECSLSPLRRGKDYRYNQKTESIDLSCNKPLLLHKIKIAKVNPKSSTMDFEGFSETLVEIQLFQKIDGNEKSLFQQNFRVSCEDEVFVKILKPLLIHPKRSYKIQLVCNSWDVFESPVLRSGKIEVDDLELNLGGSTCYTNGFTLLSSMYFNRI